MIMWITFEHQMCLRTRPGMIVTTYWNFDVSCIVPGRVLHCTGGSVVAGIRSRLHSSALVDQTTWHKPLTASCSSNTQPESLNTTGDHKGHHQPPSKQGSFIHVQNPWKRHVSLYSSISKPYTCIWFLYARPKGTMAFLMILIIKENLLWRGVLVALRLIATDEYDYLAKV